MRASCPRVGCFICALHQEVELKGSTWAFDEISEKDLAGDYPAVRYNTPDRSFGIDILARLGEAFSYSDLEDQEVVFEGIPVRVATPAMLYRMKKDTLRWKDRIDAQKIKETFSLEE